MQVHAVSTPSSRALIDDCTSKVEQLSLHDGDLFSLLDASLSNKHDTCPIDSHRPFKIIQLMANHFAKAFIETAAVKISMFPPSSLSLTSCINVTHALGVVFLGVDRAKVLMQRLNIDDYQSLRMKICVLPKTQEQSNRLEYEYTYRIENLFTGVLVQLLDMQLLDKSFTEQEENNIIEKNTAAIAAPYCALRGPINRVCELVEGETKDEVIKNIHQILEKTFSNMEYDFNRKVLQSFKDEVRAFHAKVSCQCSYIYFISIGKPSSKNQKLIHHSFTIEQFYDVQSDSLRFRLYQAWSGLMDLAVYLQNSDYSATGNGFMSHEEFQRFLYDLEIIICRTSLDKEQVIKAHERCFGVKNVEIPPLTSYDPDNKVLQGISFRYISRNFNPNDCLKNVVEFIESESELEKEVKQSLMNQSI